METRFTYFGRMVLLILEVLELGLFLSGVASRGVISLCFASQEIHQSKKVLFWVAFNWCCFGDHLQAQRPSGEALKRKLGSNGSVLWGCVFSKKAKHPPAYEDPSILASKTSFTVNQVEALYGLFKKTKLFNNKRLAYSQGRVSISSIQKQQK
ncbi:hypothetical protein J5N97_004057 [Dioscorea zingiberensis]|uniref:Uncharacterized protein n=1 Tax=Dioscorea zingiberensis TaxID=325984 RepID=A0A9D5D5E9_9LILI|nr:hypothetical protein J5N97_004057 [Dioscorea zingiberensis]